MTGRASFIAGSPVDRSARSGSRWLFVATIDHEQKVLAEPQRAVRPTARAILVASVAAAVVPFVLLGCLAHDWSLRLGFFSDDWLVLLHPMPGTYRAFVDVLNLVANRPASAPLIWISQAYIDWSHARAQVANAVGLGASAISVGLLTARVMIGNGRVDTSAVVAFSAASCVYVTLPSNVSMYMWNVSMLAVAPALIPFCLGLLLLLGPSATRPEIRALGFALLAIAHLSYEAFLFQELVVLALAASLSNRRIDKHLVHTAIGSILINVLCLGYNRMSSAVIRKSFFADWWHVFTGGYSRLGEMLASHAPHYWTQLKWISVLLLAVGISGLVRLRGLPRIASALALLVCGVLATGVLYAMAGYGLALQGVMARTSVAIGFYMSVAAGALTYGAWLLSRTSWRFKAVAAMSVAGIVACNFSSSRRVVDEWAAIWSADRARVDRIPADYEFIFNDRRLYVLRPSETANVAGQASAPWEITGLVAYGLYIASGSKDRRMMVEAWSHSGQKSTRWYVASADWWHKWDGRRFEQGQCGRSHAIYSNDGSQLLIWQLGSRSLEVAAAAWEAGCRKP